MIITVIYSSIEETLKVENVKCLLIAQKETDLKNKIILYLENAFI